MSREYNEIVSQITRVRKTKANLNHSLLTTKQQLIRNSNLLSAAINRNQDGRLIIENIDRLRSQIQIIHQDLVLISREEVSLSDQIVSIFGNYQNLVNQMDDQYPILFLPVRIETVFNASPRQLWVRIFPDEIAVDTHETALTQSEIDEGKRYWTQWVSAANEEEQIQAWDLLCRSFSAERAAWVALQMTPENIEQNPPVEALVFPSIAPKEDSWTKQPESNVMPDAFVVYAFGKDGSRVTRSLSPIPDQLKMGIDPALDPDEETVSFDQQDVGSLENELVSDEQVDWMIHFDAAIEKGLGARIPITAAQYEQGFERIMVVGIKATLTTEASRERLEALIHNHHYTDGFSLLKQGSNTNNTEEDYSGFTAAEFGNKTTYATERKAPLFTPVAYNSQKSDGQVLCEALGIEYETLHHIFQSDGTDIRSVIGYHTLAFQTHLGYMAAELLPAFGDRLAIQEDLRPLYVNYFRSRGALPSIRSGNQPYGILPTSVFSRLEWDRSDPKQQIQPVVWEFGHAIDRGYTYVMGELPTNLRPVQHVSNVLAKHAVSTDYVQRIGVSSGYAWNNIEYAALKYPEHRRWEEQQQLRIDRMIAEMQLPLKADAKGLQINYLEKQSNVDWSTVYPGANENEPLPQVSDVGNILDLLATATFDELRDEDYERYGVRSEMVEEAFSKSMLYTFSRQSLMLEYYEAACELLRIDPEQRMENEFINIIDEKEIPEREGPMGKLKAGPSRFEVMEMHYEGQRVSDLLSSEEARNIPSARNLVGAKEAALSLGRIVVKDFDLIVREGIDGVAYRLDTWRLVLVNERLNRLRGIADGSLDRNKGIYLGAYGWVENISRQTGLESTGSPTADGQFPDTLLVDRDNKGYIHAPTLNQAVTGAVMRSGYTQRATQEEENPLSVNLSSERVRAALDLMEGVRNGQNLGVLLGYEFERKFRELYQNNTVNEVIYNLRKAYPLDNLVVEVAPDPEVVEKIHARNVVNGNKLIELYQDGEIQEIIIASNIPEGIEDLLIQAVDFTWNLADAVADISTTEGIFQVVQGNTIKGGAVADALSKGRLMNEPDVIPSGKDGIRIPQRFTMHFDTQSPLNTHNGWDQISGSTVRKAAEPYINKWLSSLLPDPSTIYVQVIAVEPDTVHWVTATDINLHPCDLLYLTGEDLKDGDDQLSLIIKQYVRKTELYDRTLRLSIDYDQKPGAEYFSFAELHPVLLYAEKLLNSARPLDTHDYMLPHETEQTVKLYDINDLTTRFNTARAALSSARTTLQNALNASPFNAHNVVHALYALSFFGIEQTVFEFTADLNPEDEARLQQAGQAVLDKAREKWDRSVIETAVPGAGDDPTEYVTRVLEAFKAVLDPNYVVLPLFRVRPEEQSYLSLMLNHSSTLKNDHLDNDLLTEEWMSGIAKVQKTAEHYELLTLLASTVDPTYLTARSIVPMQLPYASDGTERWLGASVQDQSSLKEGRVAIGASVPAGHSISSNQAGIMVEEWIDVVPLKEHTTGISFHYDQPSAKAPNCLILGIAPKITGNWKWDDLVDLLEETLDLAKKRGLDYEQVSGTYIGQLPGLSIPFTPHEVTMGLSARHLIKR